VALRKSPEQLDALAILLAERLAGPLGVMELLV
jgi:hypothetical protein